MQTARLHELRTARYELRARIAALLVLLLLPLALAARAELPKERRETRYGIYFLGTRIGESKLVETPERFRGKPALKVDSTSQIRIAALGEVEQRIDLVQYVDESWSPIHLRFTMTSGGRTTRVEAEFFPDRVECELDSQGSTSKKTIPIPKGVSLVADPNLLGDRKLKVGEKRTFYLFEPLTLQVIPMEVEVLREEKLALGDKTYPATVVKTTTSITGPSTNWVTEDGQLLQGDTALGIRMVREDSPAPGTQQPAPSTRYTPPVDLAVATAVKTEKKIEQPRKLRYLRVRIAGIPERRLILSDARQRVTTEKSASDGSLTALYEVRSGLNTETRRHGDEGRRGQKEGAGSGGDSRYLAEAPYLEVKDARIRERARQIVGEESDPGRKAAKIRAWVHQRMKSDPSIGIPRSATDVLTEPKGVCRDYAVLFAALARAAGVPTRLCGGLVYFRDGFFYHAWNECLVDPARGRWQPYDATLPSDFVDATHIKFAQGDPTDMFQAVRVVGQLKAEILDYR